MSKKGPIPRGEIRRGGRNSRLYPYSLRERLPDFVLKFSCDQALIPVHHWDLMPWFIRHLILYWGINLA